jgi:small subunit ribosomal protein S6
MAEKIMNSYETIFIIDASLEEDAIKALQEKFVGLISSNGEVESVDEWGKRRLAYPINDENDGYYVLYNYECNAEFPKELDRVVGITDGVLRSLIIKK